MPSLHPDSEIKLSIVIVTSLYLPNLPENGSCTVFHPKPVVCLLLFYLSQGYEGLVDGGDNIKEVQWEEMSGIIELV